MNVVTVGRWILRGVRLVPALIHAMVAVELLQTTAPGPEKRRAALELAQRLLAITEGVADRDLLDDEAVVEAAGRVIDAIATLQKVIATRTKGGSS
jgi:hypothetical protein